MIWWVFDFGFTETRYKNLALVVQAQFSTKDASYFIFFVNFFSEGISSTTKKCSVQRTMCWPPPVHICATYAMILYLQRKTHTQLKEVTRTVIKSGGHRWTSIAMCISLSDVFFTVCTRLWILESLIFIRKSWMLLFTSVLWDMNRSIRFFFLRPFTARKQVVIVSH